MVFANWLRALKTQPRPKVKRAERRRFCPKLESLEDRTAPAVFNVTSASDAGAGSLRQAILGANAAPGTDTISISLGAGLHTINLASALPAITGTVTIDGSQSGLPKLELNGAGAGAGANGLVIKSTGTTIRGLIINRFSGNGIVITNASNGSIVVPTSNCVVEGCFIGTDAAGTGEAHNNLTGVFVTGAATGNRIGGAAATARNVISGNLKHGIMISGTTAKGNLVLGNLIGLSNAAGNPVLPNSFDGVAFVAGAKNNRVGGVVSGEGNVLSGNGRAGVSFVGAGTTGNLVQGNLIGLNATGAARPNLLGVWIAAGAASNVVGGAAGNTISGNTSAGVAVTGIGTIGNILSNNNIGTDAGGTSARPNGLDGVRIAAVAKSTTVLGNVISANGGNGVLISGVGVTGNVIKGNIIGLSAAGTVDLGNSLNGVRISEEAAANTVGGTSVADRNVISGNGGDGVLISGAGSIGNKVLGNFIGLDAAGAVDLGNSREGVEINSGAASNTIGGTVAGARNVISGNGLDGVTIQTGAKSNLVLGNFIGTDAAGVVDLGNDFGGVLINGGASNTVGGTTAGARNVVAGNGADGVLIFGVASTGNKVMGNFLGLNAAGAAALGNGSDGVEITAGAANNTLGGTVAGASNVISGNGSNGVKIQGLGATGNLVQGNRIGTDAAGTADVGNTGDGVELNAGAANNIVGGTTAAARNIISGNGANGVLIFGAGTTGNKVQGNFIGTTAAGAGDLGNAGDGVEINAAAVNNTIGGAIAGARNVISGNGANGVLIFAAGTTGNVILGNFIGTDAAGAIDLGNDGDGVEISSGAADNSVGGAVAAARNVISGNGADGVVISGAGTTGNQVLGNFIGLNAAGSGAIGNGNGVQITSGAANNTIGGTTAGARNVISGNTGNGLAIASGATANQVQGNFIGTNAAGAADLGNALHGVAIGFGAVNNTIGGAVAGARNVISGNNASGVLIFGSGTTTNKVHGNFIGVAANGTSALGNSQSGVFIAESASANAIGAPFAGAGNVIAHNGGDGVLIGSNSTITTAAGSGNSVQGNSVFTNGGLGIDLGPDDGPTANDANDPDTGPNNLLNKPVLTAAFLVGDVLLVSGTFNTELGKSLRIEFFSTPTLNAAGQAEGKNFLGFVNVNTAAANTVTFSTFLQTSSVPPGHFITATATDELGNTSEFSLGLAVV